MALPTTSWVSPPRGPNQPPPDPPPPYVPPQYPPPDPRDTDPDWGLVDKPWEGIGGGKGGGGVGGGGGSGGSGVSGGRGGPSDPGFGISQLISSQLEGIIGGRGSRYNPEIMEHLTGQLVRGRESAITRGTDTAYEDMARRGIFRSPAGSYITGDIRRSAEAQYSQNLTRLYVEKVNADHEDKMQALERAQTWLDSLRKFSIDSEMVGVEWGKIDAGLALGYSNLANQWAIANLQYQASLYAANSAVAMASMSQNT